MNGSSTSYVMRCFLGKGKCMRSRIHLSNTCTVAQRQLLIHSTQFRVYLRTQVIFHDAA